MYWFWAVLPWLSIFVAGLNVYCSVRFLYANRQITRLRAAWNSLLVQSWVMQLHPILLARVGNCILNISVRQEPDDDADEEPEPSGGWWQRVRDRFPS